MFVWLLKPYIKPLVPVEISDTRDNNCSTVILFQKQYTLSVKFWMFTQIFTDGLMQQRHNSIANALELWLFTLSHWYELLHDTVEFHCLSTHDAIQIAYQDKLLVV